MALDGSSFSSELSFLKRYMQSCGFWYSFYLCRIISFLYFVLFLCKDKENECTSRLLLP